MVGSLGGDRCLDGLRRVDRWAKLTCSLSLQPGGDSLNACRSHHKPLIVNAKPAMIIKNSAMNPIRIAIKVLVGGLSLGVFSQVFADTSLYGLNGAPPGGSITNTGATATNAGFTFSIQPGFQATFSKLGFWVNETANPTAYRATVSLYDLTSRGGVLPPPNQAQLIEQAVGNNIDSGCSLEANFCYANVANSVTLVSGRTYLLTSSYGIFLNDNTYYLSGLTTPTNVSFANNIIYGNSYLDP
jgi:hypothetical protein